MTSNHNFENLWKSFGSTSTAGRLLREIYDPSRSHKLNSAIQYPKLTMKSVTEASIVPAKVAKPRVSVPKFGKGGKVSQPIASVPGKKPARAILAEIEAFFNTTAAPRQVITDREKERRRLQEVFQFSRATCLPQSVQAPTISKDTLAQPQHRLSDRDILLQGLISQVKEDQERLELWADEVGNLGLKGDAKHRLKIVEAKRLEQLQIKNKISEAIKDIKTLIDSDN